MARLRLAALLLVAGCEASLPRRLADEAPLVRKKAQEEWSALPPARQLDVMREGLRGGDEETRRIAALSLDPRCLTLAEIRLQMAVLAGRPDGLWELTTSPRLDWVARHDLPVGSPDVPGIWRASLRVEPSDEIVEALAEYHRAALPSHVPALVALLPEAGDLFPILLWQLQNLASDTDEHRAEVARGFLVALARRHGAVPPGPLVLPSKETFLTLADAAWITDGFPVETLDAAGVRLAAPTLWLLRWAREIEFAPLDAPFLARVAADAAPPQVRAWAAGRLAELGDRTQLDRLIAEERTPLWHADPERARQDWLRRFREEAAERGEGAWTETGLFPDETEARIAPEDIAWIGEQLLASGAPAELLARYFAEVNPDALTAEAARRVLAGLRPPDPELSWPVDEFLGLCEVRDRAAVVEFLDRWARTDARALPLLAKLGEGARVEEMIATWDDWDDTWALGCVRDARVAEFLRGKAGLDALDALSTFHGLEDPGFSSRGEFHDADWAEEPFAGARRLVGAGKPVEAVLRLAELDELKEWAAATLAGVRDPAAAAFLRRMREEPWRGVYWVATAALATSGDAAALAEWRAFVGEDRIWLIDGLQAWNTRRWSILTAGGDAALVRHWVSRINTNCCLKYYAYVALSMLYPTIALENEGPGDWGQKGRTIRTWFDRHTFRRSEILGGFVPGE